MGARLDFPPVKDRFMSKVSITELDCWIWMGTYFQKKNRPAFWMKGRLRLAARAGWELFRGPIPDGKMLCHKRECSNERCVNPDHLYPGDQASNMADRDAVGRTSRWAHRYNFVQTPELESQVNALRKTGSRIEDICARLGIGRTTYYRMRARGVVD
jgi:HNH endonuclease